MDEHPSSGSPAGTRNPRGSCEQPGSQLLLNCIELPAGTPREPGTRTRRRVGTGTRGGHVTIVPRSSTSTFRRSFYPQVSDREWNDWQWQLKNVIRDPDQLARFVVLTGDERTAIEKGGASKLPFAVTPYYMSLVPCDEPGNPLRRTVVPTSDELERMPCEADDPLGEDAHSPVPGLVHRYPDRVLLLCSDQCATYCRYCTRSRLVGRGHLRPGRTRLEAAFDYIRKTPTIRDVLLSGGDPLTLSDERLDWLLGQVRSIKHVEIVRIGTKVPVVMPQRITPALVRVLRRHHPLWMSIHFTHPDECTREATRACARLADAGIPLGSQTVLLRGVNDDAEVMRRLVHNLLRMRVRPYYIYQCDPIPGSSHFRTHVSKGVEIIRALRGFTSGYAVPTFVVDAPGGGGKIPVMPGYVAGRDEDGLLLRNYEQKIFRYPDPSPADDPL